jgi:ABC-type nitrate/sulfonate/bicarbonate transport system permease component
MLAYLGQTRFVWRFMGIILFFTMWEVIGRLGVVNRLFFAPFTDVLIAGAVLVSKEDFILHLSISMTEFITGFVIAAAVGIPIGILVGWYERLYHSVEPLLLAFNATPRITLIPLLVIWFGVVGLTSKIAMVFIGAIVPLVINAVAGVRSIEGSFINVAKVFGASKSFIFKSVVLPASVPFLLTGVRLGLGQGLIGMVVGELYGATAGLGFLLSHYSANFQTDTVLFIILLISLFGVLFTEIARKIEERYEVWRIILR